MTFEIESGVAVETSRRGRKSTAFPLVDMSVGDSFLIAFDPEGEEGLKMTESWRRKLRIGVKEFNKTYEGKFQTGVKPDGLRVWRTA